MGDVSYTLASGQEYLVKTYVAFQPNSDLQVTSTELLGEYTGQLLDEIQTELGKQIAEEALVNPLLEGWKILTVEVLEKDVVRSTNLLNGNPILELTVGIYIDGTQATGSISFGIENSNSLWINTELNLLAFWQNLALTWNPFVVLYNDIKLIGWTVVEKVVGFWEWLINHGPQIIMIGGAAMIAYAVLTAGGGQNDGKRN